MNRTEITAKLIEKLTRLFADRNVDADMLMYVDFIDDMGMDSITFISIVVEVEALFEITVPDDLLLIENFRNAEAIILLVEHELEEKHREENA